MKYEEKERNKQTKKQSQNTEAIGGKVRKWGPEERWKEAEREDERVSLIFIYEFLTPWLILI